MSDNFIPFNQSTPVQNREQHDKGHQQRYNNRQQHSGKRRGGYIHPHQFGPEADINRRRNQSASDLDSSSNIIEMSDNFIPFNQSTPVQNRGQRQDNGHQQGYNNRQQHGGKWQGGYNHSQFTPYNRNNSTNRSYASNSSNNSFSQEKHNIDDYLHPSMLEDPWASL